jgi:hypothetical protein
MAEAVARRRQGLDPCLGCDLGPPNAHRCGYTEKPRNYNAIKFADLMASDDINDFVLHIRPKVVNGETIDVADTRGAGLGTWGKGDGVPVEQAKMWTKALALSCEDPRLRYLWDSPEAVDCKARALAIRDGTYQRGDHGCTTNDAKGMSYQYRANGSIAEVHYTYADGEQKSRVVRFHSHLMGALYESEACGTSPLGVAEATSRLAGFVLDAPATYDDEKEILFDTERDALFEKADAANKEHRQTLLEKQAAKLDWVREECKKRVEGGYDEARDGDLLRDEILSARHFGSRDFPDRVRTKVYEIWIRSNSADRFSKDAQLRAMREGLSHADKREIVLASLPHLRTGANGRYSAVIDWLAKNAQIDHILSTVIDNPVNLILDWSAPNGHHGDFRNCEGKAARFGEDVMDAVTKWVAAAVRAFYGVIDSA